MKKILSVSMIALTLFASTVSKNTQAGIVVGLATGDASAGVRTGATVAGVALGLNIALLGVELASGDDYAGLASLLMLVYITTPVTGAAIILDADASLPTDQLVAGFEKAYPFVDSRESLERLAHATKAKIKERTSVNPNTKELMVNFSYGEVAEIFGASDLTDENFEIIAQSLK